MKNYYIKTIFYKFTFLIKSYILWIFLFFLLSIFVTPNYQKIFEILWIFLIILLSILWLSYLNSWFKNSLDKLIYAVISYLFCMFRVIWFSSITMDLLLYKLLIFAVVDSVAVTVAHTLLAKLTYIKNIEETSFLNIQKSISDKKISLILCQNDCYLKRLFGMQKIIFMIKDNQTHKVVGNIDLRLNTNKKEREYYGNIGYEIKRKYRGNKFARQAVYLLMNYAKELNMKEIFITSNIENLASIKTIEFFPNYKKEKDVITGIYSFWKNQQIYRYIFKI